jgi:phage-related protein
MIYYEKEYKLCYFIDAKGDEPVKEYIKLLNKKERAKVFIYLEFLKEHDGYLDEPYSRHIDGKIRELRVDFARNKHRIFYFTFTGEKIVLLSAFQKKTPKTPRKEIEKAITNYNYFLKTKNNYD